MRAVIAVAVLFSVDCYGQRSWTDIKTHHPLHAIDEGLENMLLAVSPLRYTDGPSMNPSRAPSAFPSAPPSDGPSSLPSLEPSVSKQPSGKPSETPTILPSASPSTGSPSQTPSIGHHVVPSVIDSSSYFNYDNRTTSLYGPGQAELIRHNATAWRIAYQNNAWATRKPPKGYYWKELDEPGWGPWAGILANRELSKNMCSGYGKQSPIDVRENYAECIEHHQIRTRRGDYFLGTGNITAEILPNKLRLLFTRRPCKEVNSPACSEPDPPVADFPNNWGGYTDALHVDFKIPSEHLIMGERFDGEMQIFHIHPTRRRTPTVVAMMKTSEFGYNFALQNILDQFQYRFDDDAALCAAKTRRERRLVSRVHKLLGWNVSSSVDYKSWGQYSTIREDPSRSAYHRELQGRGFTPHDEMLVPSIHFWGYEGSLTEPPCTEFVSWFITDTPMTMHFTQLEQLKRLQFQYVDPDCHRTSIHFAESNARPIQDTFDRPVWRCTSQDFLSDAVRYPDGNIPPDPV